MFPSILQTLKEEGIDDNTLVIFTSDNGPAPSKKNVRLGSALPLSGHKFQTLEGGFRVPCVMRWPGVIPQGAVCNEIVSTLDFFPTFLTLAGVEKVKERYVCDGNNISPLLKREAGTFKGYECFLYYHMEGTLQAIRAGKWKYHLDVENPEWGDADTRNALFDIESDPEEKTDLKGEYPDVVQQLIVLAQRKELDIRRKTYPVGHLDSLRVSAKPPSGK